MQGEGAAEITVAQDQSDLQHIQAFKYQVYVEELGRYGDIADHQAALLVETDDATSRNLLVEMDGKLVATARLTWGGDKGALQQRQIDQYDLAPILDSVTLDQIVICERLMIAPGCRGGDLLMQMFDWMMRFVNTHRIQLFIGDCEPHLINTYQAMGFRTYTAKHVNSPATGYLIPLMIVAEDVEYLRQLGSPLVQSLKEFGDADRVPDSLDLILSGGDAVQSEQLVPAAEYLAQLEQAAAEAGSFERGLFEHMSAADIAACIRKSNMIACNPGDIVIKRGNAARNLNMVLTGAFEVQVEGRTVAQIGPGEMFGEIAFFLKQPRNADVIAVAPSRMISLNDRTIKSLSKELPATAAMLLNNIARLLCRRLDKMNEFI